MAEILLRIVIDAVSSMLAPKRAGVVRRTRRNTTSTGPRRRWRRELPVVERLADHPRRGAAADLVEGDLSSPGHHGGPGQGFASLDRLFPALDGHAPRPPSGWCGQAASREQDVTREEKGVVLTAPPKRRNQSGLRSRRRGVRSTPALAGSERREPPGVADDQVLVIRDRSATGRA